MQKIEEWEAEDDIARALSFLPEKVLPELYRAVWRLKGVGNKKKRKLWARLLVQFATISRSSDVTGEFCPLLEDVEFPTARKYCCEDGMPMCVDLKWRKWKGRPKAQKNAPYTILFFCVVRVPWSSPYKHTPRASNS